MGRPRRIKTAASMADAWRAYKRECDALKATRTEFCGKTGEFVSAVVPKAATYTVQGFCLFIGLSRVAFYETYRDDPEYAGLVDLIHDECENDARVKFETGQIPHQLAPLWMGNYGYSSKKDKDIAETGSLISEWISGVMSGDGKG